VHSLRAGDSAVGSAQPADSRAGGRSARPSEHPHDGATVAVKDAAFPELEENDPGWEFFRRFFPQPGRAQPAPGSGAETAGSGPQIPRGQGSGFNHFGDGYVMRIITWSMAR